MSENKYILSQKVDPDTGVLIFIELCLISGEKSTTMFRADLTKRFGFSSSSQRHVVIQTRYGKVKRALYDLCLDSDVPNILGHRGENTPMWKDLIALVNSKLKEIGSPELGFVIPGKLSIETKNEGIKLTDFNKLPDIDKMVEEYPYRIVMEMILTDLLLLVEHLKDVNSNYEYPRFTPFTIYDIAENNPELYLNLICKINYVVFESFPTKFDLATVK